MSDYYVYLHRRLSDNKVFYVGKGKNKRAWVKSGRSEYWNRIVLKHGYVVDIIFSNLSEEESFQIEKDTILELEYFGEPLCNLTKGGPGTSGHTVSEKVRKNISLAQKSNRTQSQLDNLTMSIKGRPTSDSHRENLSVALKGRVGPMIDKNIYLFFSEDDIFVGTRKELADKIGIKSRVLQDLFSNKRRKRIHGWSVLTGLQLQILYFKE